MAKFKVLLSKVVVRAGEGSTQGKQSSELGSLVNA